MLFTFRPVMHESGAEPCEGLALYYVSEFRPKYGEVLDHTKFVHVDGEAIPENEPVPCFQCGNDVTEIYAEDVKELQ